MEQSGSEALRLGCHRGLLQCIASLSRTKKLPSVSLGLPHGSAGEKSACNAGDARGLGSIPGLGRPPGGGNGSPCQYSHLENPMDRGAWQSTVHGITRVRHDSATKPPPPGSSVGKESFCSTGYAGLIPGLGIPSGGGMETLSSILA